MKIQGQNISILGTFLFSLGLIAVGSYIFSEINTEVVEAETQTTVISRSTELVEIEPETQYTQVPMTEAEMFHQLIKEKTNGILASALVASLVTDNIYDLSDEIAGYVNKVGHDKMINDYKYILMSDHDVDEKLAENAAKGVIFAADGWHNRGERPVQKTKSVEAEN